MRSDDFLDESSLFYLKNYKEIYFLQNGLDINDFL